MEQIFSENELEWRFVCKLNTTKKKFQMISCPQNLLLKNIKNLDKSSAGMADKSDESYRKPQATKKPRRGCTKSQEEWVITPDVVKN